MTVTESQRRPGWLAEVAREAAKLLAENPDEVQVEAIRMVGSDTAEFVYRQPWDGKLRGLRLRTVDIESGSRLTEHTTGEIAFLLVYVGILEPKSDDEFAPPDSDGISWVQSRDWLE